MKIVLSVLALLGFLFSAAAAFAAPELSVSEPNYNFGTVAQGKKVQHNFVIKNSGDAPLQIKDVSVTCGCTAAKPSSSTVAPGRSAEIQVVFDSTNFTGKVHKGVNIISNAAKAPNFSLSLEGTIIEAVQVNPQQLNLGFLKPGAAKQATISVTNRDSASVRIVSVSITSNTLLIKSNIKKSVVKPGETAIIELSITPATNARIMSGYLHIQTDSPRRREITVPVYASVAK